MNERRGFLAACLAFFGLGAAAKAETFKGGLITASWDGSALCDVSGNLATLKAKALAETGYVPTQMPGKFVTVKDGDVILDAFWFPDDFAVVSVQGVPTCEAESEVDGCTITIKLKKANAKA